MMQANIKVLYHYGKSEVTEIKMVKLPQMAIEHNWMLYMGQWLSIPMVIWSIWLVFYSIEQGKSDNLPPKIRLSRAELRRENKKK